MKLVSVSRMLAALALLVCGGAIAENAISPEPYIGRTVDDGQQMQLARYTTTLAKPSDEVADSLAVFIQINYPRQTVRSVGDAVRYTLERTGWRMVDTSALTPEAARFLTFTLPESQRSLGPYRARDVLQVLLGNTWVWHEDRVQRVVWFTVIAPVQATATQQVLSSAQPENSRNFVALALPVRAVELNAQTLTSDIPAAARQEP